ncbi:hypothetical protein [Pontibacter chitinilyticus]|uniref:hypothetical protein n=1 Tax=Pontibacter chitinilyticus TaxID=2674989 RepID=UPI00321A7349
MNTNLKVWRRQFRQLCLTIGSPLIAAAAIGCAFLVETRQLDYTYPLELVLKGITNDSAILTISTK